MQLRRFARQLPGMACMALCLLVGVLVALNVTVSTLAESEEQQRFPVALCGSTDDPFLQMGLQMLTGFDSSRFTIELRPMEWEEAEQALSRGDVAACVVIPEGFMDAAMAGQLMPLEFVSTARASGLVSLFKEEMTQAISQYILASQKGVFGIENAVQGGLITWDSGANMDTLALRYVERILIRDQFYTLEELGIADQLPLDRYLLCGLGVLLACLCCLSFGPLLLRRDTALERMLWSRGVHPLSLAARTFLAYYLNLCVLLLPMLAGLLLLSPGGAASSLGETILRLLPVILCIASLSFLLYALSAELIGGMLLQFFAGLGLCFVSGCMYPVYFFPSAIQELAQWLPTGLARSQLAACLTGRGSAGTFWALLAWCVLFTLLGILAQTRHYREVRT